MAEFTRLDSNIESKSSNYTYLNIIKIFYKLSKKLFDDIIQWFWVDVTTKALNFNYLFEYFDDVK